MAAEGNLPQEDLISQEKEKCDALKAELIRVKHKLSDLDSDLEALEQQHQMEIEAITTQWDGGKSDLRAHLKGVKHGHKAVLKALQDKQKARQKTFKAEIK